MVGAGQAEGRLVWVWMRGERGAPGRPWEISLSLPGPTANLSLRGHASSPRGSNQKWTWVNSSKQKQPIQINGLEPYELLYPFYKQFTTLSVLYSRDNSSFLSMWSYMQISNCRLGGLLSAPKQHIVQESATIHASVKLILTCLRRDVCYMLWFISCTKSTGRNIFSPVISKGLSWRQNMSISIFAPKKWWKRLSEISKGNQEIQSPVMCQELHAF